MKRTGYLLDSIAEYSNLYYAYWKASRLKKGKKEVIEFSKNIDSNLKQIQKQILCKTLDIGNYHYFTIYDPKEREICAASFKERVLHHAIMNICETYFEKFQIYHSYATRKDKGTHKAIEYARVQTKNNKFFVKLDVRKYFDSIDHTILIELLKRKFKDPDLLYLFTEIINSYSTAKGKGIPIGNLTSQYFANFYLAWLDHFIKEELRIKSYVRYMDDMVIWDNSKEVLKSKFIEIEDFLNNKLFLTFKPKVLNQTSRGLPFLGFGVFPNLIKLNKRSKKRFFEKAEKYENHLISGYWSQEVYQAHILPLLDFIDKANTYNLRKSFFKRELIEGL